MPPELNSVLSVAIPSFIAVVGSIIAAIYVRRSNREQNDTNAFQAVTDQLFKLNGELRTDLTEVKHKVIALEAAVAAKDAQIERLETDLEDTGSKWRSSCPFLDGSRTTSSSSSPRGRPWMYRHRHPTPLSTGRPICNAWRRPGVRAAL